MEPANFEYQKREYKCSLTGGSWILTCGLNGCPRCLDYMRKNGVWGNDKLFKAARVWNYYGTWPGPNDVKYLTREEVESLPRPSFRERMGSAAGSSTKRRVKTRTVERTWSRLSEAQRIVLDASAPSSHTGDGRLFKRGRLRTARSVQDRGLLVERGPNRFTRTAYGQKVIDWKNSNEHR